MDFGSRSFHEFWQLSKRTNNKYARGVVVGGHECPSIKAGVRYLYKKHGIWVSDYKMRKEAKRSGEIKGVKIKMLNNEV